MTHFIDRRLNPKNKSLGNRRKFIKRVRSSVKQAVDATIRSRKLDDIDRGEHVNIPAGGIAEPRFRYAPEQGRKERTLTGNKEFMPGDKIAKPQGGSGQGRAGSDEGNSEDDFLFVLSREDFLDILFEDLELPDLVKLSLKEIDTFKMRRAGFSTSGSPTNLSVDNTMRNALGRRLALKRPSDTAIHELQAELFDLETISSPSSAEKKRLAEIHEELEQILRRQRSIAYIDPLDVRYRTFQKRPEPNAHAVMFCLMDVSASMGEREKDLAKRFFVLLHLFLKRRYDRIELVFIRHTQHAEEVDEDTFFHSRETGGTVVSTALSEMKRVITARYLPSEWNIYAAQASDGENIRGDSTLCREILQTELMPLCQYFAYIEIVQEIEAELLPNKETGGELWQNYRNLAADWQNFAMKRISSPSDIYPVFQELFTRQIKDRASA